MILEVHLIPASAFFLFVQKQVISIPARIAMTGPPMTGNIFSDKPGRNGNKETNQNTDKIFLDKIHDRFLSLK